MPDTGYSPDICYSPDIRRIPDTGYRRLFVFAGYLLFAKNIRIRIREYQKSIFATPLIKTESLSEQLSSQRVG